ncbi:MAG: methyltransferase domain-containing protein [Verrucomicrobiota bacterium]
MNELNVLMAKSLMRLAPRKPLPPDVAVGDLGEVFRHEIYTAGSEEKRRKIRRESAEYFYHDELKYPWDKYFGVDLQRELAGKVALDLGCFTGGRSIAWHEMYQLKRLVGVDVENHCIEAATEFARHRGVDAEFTIGFGEKLPFEDGSFDAVLSFETFEHVRNVGESLAECHRVLRSGGRLYAVFPSYFHPIEHHLKLVTATPFISILFSGGTLVKAYYDILQERGAEACWYARKNRELERWERGNTLNGMTFSGFSRLARQGGWRVSLVGRKPIGSIGRNASKHALLSACCNVFYPLTMVRGLQELFLHHIVFILEKR